MVEAVIKTVGSVVGANKTANAAKDAASLQYAAAKEAGAQELAMFEQNREDMMPWRDAGLASLNKLSDLLGTSANTGAEGYGSLLKPFGMSDFQADPGYEFRMSEGLKALDRSASAKGKLFSGEAGKSLQRFGQGLASDEYGKAYDRFNTNQSNIYSRLAGLSGTGQTAGAQVANLGATATSNANNWLTGGAASLAAGKVGAADAWNSGLQGVGEAWGKYFNPNTYMGGSTQPGTFFKPGEF